VVVFSSLVVFRVGFLLVEALTLAALELGRMHEKCIWALHVVAFVWSFDVPVFLYFIYPFHPFSRGL
jgi:hypothetical protein